MIIDERTYDILAWINRIGLPAITTMALTILGCCKVEVGIIALVGGILGAVNTCLGKLLEEDKKRYNESKEGKE